MNKFFFILFCSFLLGATAMTTNAQLTWNISNDTLIISGNGEMRNYDKFGNGPPWYNQSFFTTVVINNGVTSIGREAFIDCTRLTEIIIPNSVTTIGYHAFKGCVGLITIDLPASIKFIKAGIFEGCKNLTSVTIPNSVTIDNTASLFAGCENLTTVIIPTSVTEIGPNTFDGCKKLTSIVIPNSVTSICANAFAGCENLTSIIIPNSVTNIGAYAFAGCTNLTSIQIPKSIKTMGKQVFFHCDNLNNNLDVAKYISNDVKTAWAKAKKEDDINGYNQYIKDYPLSKYATVAQKRIEKFGTINVATVEIDYPKSVVQSFYTDGNRTTWTWTTYFTEKNSKAGFRLYSPTYSITKGSKVWYPPNGDRRTVNVNKGSVGSTNMKLYGDELRGGTFKREWEGTDEFGNQIKKVELVILK